MYHERDGLTDTERSDDSVVRCRYRWDPGGKASARKWASARAREKNKASRSRRAQPPGSGERAECARGRRHELSRESERGGPGRRTP